MQRLPKYKDDLQHQRTIEPGQSQRNRQCRILRTVKRWRWISGAGQRGEVCQRRREPEEVYRALRTADYHLMFPDDTPVKVLRRGCSLVR